MNWKDLKVERCDDKFWRDEFFIGKFAEDLQLCSGEFIEILEDIKLVTNCRKLSETREIFWRDFLHSDKVVLGKYEEKIEKMIQRIVTEGYRSENPDIALNPSILDLSALIRYFISFSIENLLLKISSKFKENF